MRAIEATGRIDEQRRLQLDGQLPVERAGPVRIILIPDGDDADEVDERAWLPTAASNPAFDFLGEPDEDIYTLDDGRPFDDPR